MSDAETSPPDEALTSGTSGADADALDLAARAILEYLDDLAACRELCLRHEASTGVVPGPDGMRLVGAAELTPEGELAHVRAALEALPPAGRWRGGPVRENGEATTPGRKAIARHVLWEGEPLHAAVSPEGFGLLRIDLLLPGRPEWSRHPLRAAASALRVLEHLLPPDIASAIPLSELEGAPPANLLEALRRATPGNLPSSQCIWPAQEEQCPTPETAPPTAS